MFGVFADAVGKGMKIFGFLKLFRLKYPLLLVVVLAICSVVLGTAAPRSLDVQPLQGDAKRDSLTPKPTIVVRDSVSGVPQSARRLRRQRRNADSVVSPLRDSLKPAASDTAVISHRRDTTKSKKGGSMIDQIISGKKVCGMTLFIVNVYSCAAHKVV